MTPQQETVSSTTVRKYNADWLKQLLASHEDTSTTLAEFRDKALVVAPMVDQSDLPFRLLCRRYGANLCFTPMIHARMFCERGPYRERFFDLQRGVPNEDRPLIAQLCGSDPDSVLKTALAIQPFVDGIDLNCGCPQGIARRGMYGAFLLERGEDLLVPLVKRLADTLDVPVSVKVRLLPSGVEDSLRLYRKLVDAGASMLTIHGRNRFQKGPLTGRADWDAIKRAVQEFPEIPVLANGSIACLQDIRDCLEYTGAAGVMSSEAVLEYPPVFLSENRTTAGRVQVAREYLALARQYPPERGGQGTGRKCVRAHLHRFLHADLQRYPDVRDLVTTVGTMQEFEDALDKLQEIHNQQGHRIQDEQLSWYMRHQVSEKDVSKQAKERQARDEAQEVPEEEPECMACFFGEDDDGDY